MVRVSVNSYILPLPTTFFHFVSSLSQIVSTVHSFTDGIIPSFSVLPKTEAECE